MVSEVLDDREFWIEAWTLEDYPEIPPDGVRLTGEVVAKQACHPAGRRHQGGEDLEEGRLAAPIRPEETEDLSARYGKGDAGERLPVSVHVTEVFNLDGGDINSWGSCAHYWTPFPDR